MHGQSGWKMGSLFLTWLGFRQLSAEFSTCELVRRQSFSDILRAAPPENVLHSLLLLYFLIKTAYAWIVEEVFVFIHRHHKLRHTSFELKLLQKILNLLLNPRHLRPTWNSAAPFCRQNWCSSTLSQIFVVVTSRKPKLCMSSGST